MDRLRRIRVLTVEPHSTMQEGLTAVLSGVPEVELIGGISAVADILHEVQLSRPDLLVVDAGAQHGDGVRVIAEVARARLGIPIIALVAYEWDEIVGRVIEAGATAFLPRDRIGEQLAPLIYDVCSRQDKP